MYHATSLPQNPTELATALKARGYIKLRCQPDVTAAVNKVLEEAGAFFSLPLAIKTQNALGDLCEGYRGLGAEYSDVAERPDLHESFWLHAFNAEQALTHFDHHGQPLYQSMLHIAQLFDRLIASILVTLQRYYDVPNPDEPHFATAFGSHLQLNYYNPSKHQRDLLMDCHEDGLLFTIQYSNASGLEIRTRDGSFAPVTTERDELFIMPSDIAMLLSGGEIQPLYHRVRNMPEVQERMSLMYFANPNASYDGKIKPWREAEVNRDVDIMRRVIENPLKFGLPPIPIVTSSPRD
ncbi:MAG: 2OG-Fe(II) oxygenase family protein [Geminicoccaceae bacterium]